MDSQGAPARRRGKVPYVYAPLPRTFSAWLPHISASELKVYMAVFSHTNAVNRFTGSTIPMSELTAATGNLSRSTISRAISDLEKKNLIRVTRGIKRVSKYEILTTRYVSHQRYTEDGLRVAPTLHVNAV